MSSAPRRWIRLDVGWNESPRGTGWPERTGPTPTTGLCYCPTGYPELYRFEAGVGCSRCGGIWTLYEPPIEPDPAYLAKRKLMREEQAARKEKARNQNAPTRMAAA